MREATRSAATDRASTASRPTAGSASSRSRSTRSWRRSSSDDSDTGAGVAVWPWPRSPAAAQEPTLATVLERAGAYVADHRTSSRGSSRRNATSASGRSCCRAGWPLTRPAAPRAGVRPADRQARDRRPLAAVPRRLRRRRRAGARSRRAADEAVSAADRIAGRADRSASWTRARATTSATSSGTSTRRCSRCSSSTRATSRASASSAPDDRNPALAPTRVDAPRLPAASGSSGSRRSRPTVIHKTQARRDLPSHGRFWIEPASGRVLMSELVAENREVRATIDVSYSVGAAGRPAGADRDAGALRGAPEQIADRRVGDVR